MTFTSLCHLPWRRAASSSGARPEIHALGDAWLTTSRLANEIDRWHAWLATQPRGAWLLYHRDPALFCPALLALWETGQSAVLPGDDRPQALAAITSQVVGRIPEHLPAPADDAPYLRPVPATPATLDRNGLAVTLYTSGSTGAPVSVDKRFACLEAELDAHHALWPLASDEQGDAAVISQVSHQHIYGLLVGLLRPLCAGVPFCARDCGYPEVLGARLEEAYAAGKAAVIASSPPQLARLPEHIDWASRGRIACIFSSGAPLAQRHAARTETLMQAPVIEIYGSTETGGIGYRRQRDDADWQPLPGVEFRIEAGTLQLRSPFLSDVPSPTQWWTQPDRAEANGERFLLLGRQDRIAKVAGKRVSLTALEQALQACDTVIDARCVTLHDDQERLGAIVALEADAIPQARDERHALLTTLRQHLSQRFEGVAIPRYWRFVDAVPRNTQGKLDNVLVKRLFADLNDSRLPRWLGDSHPAPNTVRVTLEVPEQLRYLDGHFDSLALVPGVVMVQWAYRLGEQYWGKLGPFRGVERVKFQQMLRPGTRCTLTLERHPRHIAFRFSSGHASGQEHYCLGKLRLDEVTDA